MRDFGGGYFDILKDGNILLEASVEDDTFEIFIHETRPQKDKFRDFARQRCRIICDADGPDGSTCCREIEREREWVSLNGLRVMEFILSFTREDYQDRSEENSRIGPVYVVDISRADRPLALMIHPGHGILASDSTQGLITKIVDSVKLVP